MVLKKIARVILIVLCCLLGILTIGLVVTVAPIDRQIDRLALTAQMNSDIDALSGPVDRSGQLMVGYSKVNITPDHKTSTAGYGKRMGKQFTEVHDSIFVRTLVIKKGEDEVAIVSADLLIIPPEVTLLLEETLPDIGFDISKTYLGAIHTHNSIGNWQKGAMALMYGQYDEDLVKFLTHQIRTSIEKARAGILASTIKTGMIPVKNAVSNRIRSDGPVDTLLRCIEISRVDSSKLLMMNFTAHATCLFSSDLELSRDYPGQLVDLMEDRGYDFAMFMAGAVGSHKGKVKEQGWPCIDELAGMISDAFIKGKDSLKTDPENTVWINRVPLILTDPQMKISESWRIRPWLFEALLGDYPEYLTVLRLGDLVMIGTPCDYSGEFYPTLDSLASSRNVRVMITCFNGGYIGYVTPTKYYDREHYETQLMNWYGPGNAEYLEACIEHLLIKASDIPLAGERAPIKN
ncbi:MAG: hypothetical protein ABIS36_17495 [Chryseolinea sp.]